MYNYGSCCCPANDEICKILSNTVKLQREAVRAEFNHEMCDAKTLGCGRLQKFNTRPVQIFTDDDVAWKAPINRSETQCNEEPFTCVFRVERVQGCTATFRALIPIGQEEMGPNEDFCKPGKFISTDSFITIKLANISAIRCLNDTFVDICIR